jgi:hypothetical protein
VTPLITKVSEKEKYLYQRWITVSKGLSGKNRPSFRGRLKENRCDNDPTVVN